MSYYVSMGVNIKLKSDNDFAEIEKYFEDLFVGNDITMSDLIDSAFDVWIYANWSHIGDEFEHLLAGIAEKCAEGEIECSAEDGEFWKYEFDPETGKWSEYYGVKAYRFGYVIGKKEEE